MEDAFSSGEFKWNHYYFIDCIEGLKKIGDKRIDLAYFDPPYNVSIGKTGFRKTSTTKSSFYNDSMPREEYEKWCRSWFSEVKRTCKMIMFTPGKPNENMWIKIEEPIDKIYQYKSNSCGPGTMTWKICTDVVLIYGDWDRKQVFPSDVYEEPIFTTPYKHACPKNYNFWYRVIEDALKRVKIETMIDIFLGSGTSAEVAMALGIKWIGFEIDRECENDIKQRIYLGKRHRDAMAMTL